MKPVSFARRFRGAFFLTLTAAAAACGPSDPLGMGSQPVVLMGRVSSIGSSLAPTAAPAATPALVSDGSSLAGIEVGVEGTLVTTLTDDSGAFRLEVEAEDGRLVIRFRRGALDARIVLEGVTAGTTLRIEVSLSGDAGRLLSRRDGHDDEFEGRPTFVSLTGDEGDRTLRVSVADWGRILLVDVSEATTAFEADGDVKTFVGLLAVLDRTDLSIEVEGDGEVRDDGTVLATSIKVETDDDDDDADNSGPGSGDDGLMGSVEYKGIATVLSSSGESPLRTIRVRAVDGWHAWDVDLVEGALSFDGSGDLSTFGALAAALSDPTVQVRIEGRATVQEDESLRADTIKAEID